MSVRAMLRRFGAGDHWRERLGQVVAGHVGQEPPAVPTLHEVEVDDLTSLVKIATAARGHVPRDSRGDVVGDAEVEGVPRMAEALVRLVGALAARHQDGP